MDTRKDKITATLVFLVKKKGKQKKVLLAQKTRKINVGRFCGFGGSSNERETPRKCAVRELKDESGYVALKKDLEFVGVVTFHNQRKDRSRFSVRVFVFILTKWRGKLKLKEDEMINPKWFKTYRLPLKRMPPGDKTFAPQLLDGSHAGQIVRGEIWYSPKQEKLLQFDIKWVAKTDDVD